jgi:hypothetical protein
MRWLLAPLVLSIAACGRRAPAEIQGWVDAERSTALQVAEAAAKSCLTIKDRSGLPGYPAPIEAKSVMPPNVAKGTSLESDPHVVDVYVMCSWPGKDATWVGTGMTPLRASITGRMERPVTMPKDFVENTCSKDQSKCERVRVPSAYSKDEETADLQVVRPMADGGRAEVTVVFAKKR